jgi:hypothetical protein
VVIYAESASFLRFVRERYGTTALKQIWQNSLARAAAELGTTPTRLEAGWRARLAAIPAAKRRVDWNYVRTRGCE